MSSSRSLFSSFRFFSSASQPPSSSSSSLSPLTSSLSPAPSSQALSNATYRRNTRRHYHQQKQIKINEKRKKKWRSILSTLQFPRSSVASATAFSGSGGAYYHSFRNYSNSYYNSYTNTSNYSSSSPYYAASTFYTASNGKRRRRYILLSALITFFLMWSCVMSSFLNRANASGSTGASAAGFSNPLQDASTKNANGGSATASNHHHLYTNYDHYESVKSDLNANQQSKQKQHSVQQKPKNQEHHPQQSQKQQQQKQQQQQKHGPSNNILQPEQLIHLPKTGAWANCTNTIATTYQQHQHHPDQRTTIVSCHTIQYRVKKSSLLKMKTDQNSIVIGVLSSAAISKEGEGGRGSQGYTRRQSIRETWAHNQTGIFFLVAQPFQYIDKEYVNNNKNSSKHSSYSSSLEEEYETYGDLIWIDEDEVYDGEKSVLTYKTLSFVNIVHDLVLEDYYDQQQQGANVHSGKDDVQAVPTLSSSFVKYLFKTDDDSYVHIQNLHNHLLSSSLSSKQEEEEGAEQQQKQPKENHHRNRDYWGQCKDEEVEPPRSSNKWSASMQLYPEQLYPKYCQGAGFALSWNFVQCAASSLPISSSDTNSNNSSSSSNNSSKNINTSSHIAKARFMPFEDVAVGLMVQRCHLEPTPLEDENWINMYRFGRSEEKWRVNQGLERMPKWKLPKPNMDGGRFVQHRIYDDWDMKEHHKVVVNKERYNTESKVQWYYRPEQKE